MASNVCGVPSESIESRGVKSVYNTSHPSLCLDTVCAVESFLDETVCRRLGEPRPEQDIDLNPAVRVAGDVPRDSDGGLRFGWLTALGRRKSTVEICVSQPLRLSRADRIKRGREIKRYFRSSIIGHGDFYMWGAHV